MASNNLHSTLDTYYIDIQNIHDTILFDDTNDEFALLESSEYYKEIITKHDDTFAKHWAWFKKAIFEPILWWYKCHPSGKVIATILQMMVIGDIVSDLVFLWSLIRYGKVWWVFFSTIIMYLNLRFTTVLTATFEDDFFGTRESKRIFNKILSVIWNLLRQVHFKWENKNAQTTLTKILLLIIPGAWHLGKFLQICLSDDEESKFEWGNFLLFLVFTPSILIPILIVEAILVPICVALVSPIVIVGHAVKAIDGIWKTESSQLYVNSYKIQSSVFYAAIATIFETILESVPQFALQSWIYWHSVDLIPVTTYYISAGFSLFNIVKAIIIFFVAKKFILFSAIRLANGITSEHQVCELNENGLKLKLQGKDEKCIIEMINHYQEFQELDISCSNITDDGLKKVENSLNRVKYLNISETKISYIGIQIIAENCYQLDSLDLSATNISDQDLELLVESCHQLNSLNLFNTKITDRFESCCNVLFSIEIN